MHIEEPKSHLQTKKPLSKKKISKPLVLMHLQFIGFDMMGIFLCTGNHP